MSHRSAFLLLLAVFCAFFGPLLARGEVIYPHDNTLQLGLPSVSSERISNRKFSDQSSYNIPEIHLHLHGARSGWIATWNPHVELGRPAVHVGAHSPAFLITYLLSLATDDAFTLYTWLAITAVLLTGVFAYLWLQSLELHPAACLAGALGLSLGIFVTYWLTFMVFFWGICWTLALLWLVQRFVERSTLAGGVAIAFAIHALLLTGYPQQTVWHAYLLTGFTLVALARRPGTMKDRLGVALRLFLAVLTGVVSAAPVYLDLALTATRSVRFEPDPAELLHWMVGVGGRSWKNIALVMTTLVDAFWFGNPIEAGHRPAFDGQCLTPLFSVLLLVSLADGQWRRLWFWQAFVGVCVVLSLWPDAYLLGARYLGLWISPWDPLMSAYIPALTLAACAADHVLRVGLRHRGSGIIFLALLPGVALAAGAFREPGWLQLEFVAIGAALFVTTLSFAWTRSPALLVALAIVSTLHYGSRLVLARPREEIRLTSPLVEMIRHETRDGSRYAWVLLWTIPSNQEILLGLHSIHTYDTLSSRAYRDWVRRLSSQGTTGYRGGYFHRIVPDGRLDVRGLALAGVSLVLSPSPLDSDLAESLGRYGRAGIYRLRQPPLLQARVDTYRVLENGDAVIEGPLDRIAHLDVKRTVDLSDQLRFQLPQSVRETLLFVSQQYHPQWKAFSGTEQLQTLPVNGFYTGVIVPPGATEVELRFRPWARWSWIPHVFFVALGVVSAGLWFQGREGRVGKGPK